MTPAPAAPVADPLPGYLAARKLDPAGLRALLPWGSPARKRIDPLLGLLASHTPEPPVGFEGWGLARVAYTIELLNEVLPAGAHALDIGSGVHFSFLVSRSLPGVTWTPTDGEFAAAELRHTPTGDVGYKYDPLPFFLKAGRLDIPGTEPLDAATLFEVVEHLNWNPGPLFGSVNARLKPGGRLVVSTPNVCGRGPVLRQLRGGSPHQTPFLQDGLWYHRKEYAPWELRLLFEWAGFEVEAIRCPNLYPSDPRGWRALVTHAALLAAAGLSFSPVQARHLLRHFGSTQFVVGRKVREPNWGVDPPAV